MRFFGEFSNTVHLTFFLRKVGLPFSLISFQKSTISANKKSVKIFRFDNLGVKIVTVALPGRSGTGS